MGDLILRSEAIRAFEEKREEWYGNGPLPSIESLMWQAAISITVQLPAVDAAPVIRGTWEPSPDYPCYHRCSVCKDTYIDPEWIADGKWSYCPNCGAKIDKEG